MNINSLIAEGRERIENGTPPEITPEQQTRDAQAVIDADRQARLQAAQQDLAYLLKRHNITLGTRQVIVNGQPGPTEVTITLN
jgi:hypothetical protein